MGLSHCTASRSRGRPETVGRAQDPQPKQRREVEDTARRRFLGEKPKDRTGQTGRRQTGGRLQADNATGPSAISFAPLYSPMYGCHGVSSGANIRDTHTHTHTHT